MDQGEIFGFLGPNGAGKTTFIRILLSLVHSTSGSISLLETPLPNTQVRRRVGYLPENHRYPTYMTGKDVLRLFGRLTGMNSVLLKERIPELLRRVGMEQWQSMKVKRYSKGMLQRIGLAQALVNDPELIFLDEPTDGVDPVGRKEIRDILKELKGQGKTIFLNSHLLSEVELVCDRVAIIDKGSLLKVGTIGSLTEAGRHFIIGIEGILPEALRTEAAAMVMGISERHDGITIDASTSEELNRAIDLLRRHHVIITSVNQERSSLEDSFLNLLQKGGNA